MANVAQLKDRIFRSTNYQYNETFHMLDLLNDALNIMVDGAKLRTKTTIYVSAGLNSYPLPDNFKAPGQLLDETQPNATLPYELVDIGENRFGYSIEAGNIYIKPVPTQDVTLTFYYYNYATPLVLDTDVPTDIDSQYHNLLATYAVSQIIPLVKNDTTTRYSVMAANLADNRAWQQWKDGLSEFIQVMTKKNRSSKVREKIVW